MARRGTSRRVFLHRLTFMGGGVVLLGGPGCKKDEAPPKPAGPSVLTTSHKTFTNDEFAVLSAACERILPKDEDPGAIELGVPQYIDNALQAPQLRQMKEEFVRGLRALDRRAARLHQKGFHELPVPEQEALLVEFKEADPSSGESRFYEVLIALTMEGAFGDPSYGGNKDKQGWALIGFGTHPPGPGYDGIKHLQDPFKGGDGGGCH